MKMKRKTFLILSLAVMMLSFASPASALYDVVAYIDYDAHNGCTSNTAYVRGKAYAFSNDANVDYVNVYGVFKQGSTQKESGVASASKGDEAAVYTKMCTYSSSNSYTQSAAGRRYYTNGSSDASQKTASYSW